MNNKAQPQPKQIAATQLFLLIYVLVVKSPQAKARFTSASVIVSHINPFHL
jgi:hypothetical protein